VRVEPVSVREPGVLALLDALTAELAEGGYGAAGTFGYSADRLAAAGVHLVGAYAGGELVGVGGVEVAGTEGELKRFYVGPAARGSGAADAILAALVAYAAGRGVTVLRLETGDRQHAAMAFYRRNGFADIDRFGPYVDSPTSVCMERRL
jgi:putative acetyltransferase